MAVVVVAWAVVEEVKVDRTVEVRDSGDEDLVDSADFMDERDFVEVIEAEEYAYEEVRLLVVCGSRLVFGREAVMGLKLLSLLICLNPAVQECEGETVSI